MPRPAHKAQAPAKARGIALACSDHGHRHSRCHTARVDEDDLLLDEGEVLAKAREAAEARVRAQQALKDAEHVEDLAIQDSYEVLGPVYGTITRIAAAVYRSTEHIRRVLDPKIERGRYRRDR